MFTAPPDNRTLWQRRAEALGFTVYQNRRVQSMSDDEIEAAISDVSRLTRTFYIWP